MARQLMRLSRRLARNKSHLAPRHRAANDTPPSDATTKLKSAAAGLRETAGTDATIDEMCDSVENLLCQGWTVRHGGEATKDKRWPLLPEWKGREPPENP